MDGLQAFDWLELQNDLVLNHDIDSLAAKQLFSIHDGNQLLTLVRNSRVVQLDANGPGVNPLEKAGPECGMKGNAAANGPAHKVFEFIRERRGSSDHEGPLFRGFVVSWLHLKE